MEEPKLSGLNDGSILIDWKDEGVALVLHCGDYGKARAWAKLLATAPYLMNSLLTVLNNKEHMDLINTLRLKGILRELKKGLGK